MSKVPTPGTADWLRYVAKGMEEVPKSDLMREGLIRAANRIERLQNALGMQKTGVDPSYKPMPALSQMTQFQMTRTRPRPVTWRIRLPKPELPSDKRDIDRVFAWINGSENLGMGLLDPCEVFVLGEPDVNGGTWDFDEVIGISTLMKDKHPAGFVRISGTSRKGPLNLLAKPLGSIDLTGCYVLDVESGGPESRTMIELAAQSAEPVKVAEESEEDEDDDDEE